MTERAKTPLESVPNSAKPRAETSVSNTAARARLAAIIDSSEDVIVSKDLGDRKQAEILGARLAAIIETSEDAIISKDLKGTIATWNRGAERIFGYTPEEAIGQPVTMLMPPDRYNEEPGILARIGKGERIEHYETVRRRKDGTMLEISLTVSPIIDSRGKIIGISKIARDISKRKRAEEEARQTKERLAGQAAHLEQLVMERTAELMASNKNMEALVYSIAHDLRAPLRAMQGFSEMLVEEAGAALSETGQDFAKRIAKSAQFMDALLLDLVAFSRFNHEKPELEPLNLGPVVNSVVERFKLEMEEKKARVEAAPPWPTVLAHPGTLGQVLVNLLNNALKFIVPDQPLLVRLRAEAKGDFVRIWVEDNGIGIAPENQAEIFGVFTRLHGQRYPGTGIGLAIVQKAIERMGGRVGVESVLGKGSRFWVELPKG
jgi:PAS domain S-box-containing protein